MATAAAARNIKDIVFEWEGKDKNGKLVRGEMRAGGEAMVGASLRRQGILVNKVKKRRMSGGKAIKQKTAYEIGVRLVGSEMCIRDSRKSTWRLQRPRETSKTSSSSGKARTRTVSYTHLTLPTNREV